MNGSTRFCKSDIRRDNTADTVIWRPNGNADDGARCAVGSMRLDLLVVYQRNKYPIEIKLEYQMKKKTIEGWLVVFDRSKEKTWDEKIRWETKEIDHKTVHVVWC